MKSGIKSNDKGASYIELDIQGKDRNAGMKRGEDKLMRESASKLKSMLLDNNNNNCLCD